MVKSFLLGFNSLSRLPTKNDQLFRCIGVLNTPKWYGFKEPEAPGSNLLRHLICVVLNSLIMLTNLQTVLNPVKLPYRRLLW